MKDSIPFHPSTHPSIPHHSQHSKARDYEHSHCSKPIGRLTILSRFIIIMLFHDSDIVMHINTII